MHKIPEKMSFFKKSLTLLIVLGLILLSFWSLSRNENLPVVDAHVPQEYAESVKDWYRDEHGQTYLFTPDSYYWFRLTRNLVEKGHVGNIRQDDGTSFDDLRFFPAGDTPPTSFFPHILAFVHQSWQALDSTVSLEKTLFYTPVFAGMLSVLIVFLIGRHLRGLFCGGIAAGALALHPLFILFNYGGYVDTQIVTLLLSTVTIYFTVLLFSTHWAVRALIIPLLGTILWMMYHVWRGSIFLIFVLTTGLVAWASLLLLRKIILRKQWPLLIVFLFLTSIFFVATLWLLAPYEGPIRERLGLSEHIPFFPSGFEAVGELSAVHSIPQFVGVLGGWIIILLVFGECVRLSWQNFKNPQLQELLLISWFILLIIPGIHALRFLYLGLPPLALLLGLGAHNILHTVSARCFHTRTFFTGIALTLLVGFAIWDDTFMNVGGIPAANDAFVEAAYWVQSHTSNTSIIVAFWDYGYVWQTFAQRPTLFDGGLFSTPYLYWVSRALTTPDVQFANSVLQVLACKQHQFLFDFQGVENYLETLHLTEQLIQKPFIDVFNDHAFDVLDTTAELVKNIRCSSAPQQHPTYVFVTQDLLYKLRFLRWYATWDFTSAKQGLEMQDPQQIFVSPLARCVGKERVTCDPGIVVNLTTQDARLNGVHPQSLIIVKKGIRSQIKYNDTHLPFSVVLFDEGAEWRALAMDPAVAQMLVVRMFTGEHIPGFKKVYQTKENPERVLIYQPLFRNESITSIPKNVSLTTLSADLFSSQLLNVTLLDIQPLLSALQPFVLLNLSYEYEIFFQNTLRKASKNFTGTVEDYERNLRQKIQEGFPSSQGSLRKS